MNPDSPDTVMIYIPGEAKTAAEIVQILNQVIGQNVRLGAHDLFHATERDDTLSPTERTIRYAQIEGLLDYADGIDRWNINSTQWMREHFGWAFPTTPEEIPDGTD